MSKMAQKGNKLIILVSLVIFTGGVFLSSGKFVDSSNTPKFYFVVATLLVVALITAIHKKQINLGVFSSKTILWGINIICFIQACYGLCQ
jgi:O-antigen polymerase